MKRQYLIFREARKGPKTSVFAVLSGSHGDLLGKIAWHGPWRQYVFTPGSETIWSQGCLQEVEGILAQLALARREEAKARREARREKTGHIQASS